jgi:hypothetical protein
LCPAAAACWSLALATVASSHLFCVNCPFWFLHVFVRTDPVHTIFYLFLAL